MSGLLSRLSLKGKQFKIFQAATDEEISVLWGFIRAIDGSIGEDDKSAADLKGKKSLEEFVDHCCISRHYFFVIKNVGLKTVVSVLPPDHQLTFLPLCIRYLTLSLTVIIINRFMNSMERLTHLRCIDHR